ncbi:unnamed protein product [Leuciscus chuanchicus]
MWREKEDEIGGRTSKLLVRQLCVEVERAHPNDDPSLISSIKQTSGVDAQESVTLEGRPNSTSRVSRVKAKPSAAAKQIRLEMQSSARQQDNKTEGRQIDGSRESCNDVE